MNNFTQQKHRKFVELLYRKTTAKQIAWVVNEQNQLYATIAGRILLITTGVNEHGEDIIVFTIFQENGAKSDGFNDDALSFDNYAPNGFDNWYLLCNAIFELGKRQASGADDALDAMIDELDDEVPF